TTGANPQVHIYLDFLDGQDNGLGSVAGPTTTLTGSPTASWTRKSTAGTAPAGTVWAQVGLVLDVAPSSAWSLQADGLQYEQNNSARSYQTCPQIASVQATGVFGNGNATSPGGTFINLAQPLVNNHAVGEYVCDLLPPGATSPLSYPGTARLAY
ncbi:MAG TPA: hypothetical protein VFN97_18010, partial [Actinospica sp.]|nr:hypothetical protein [Actinospica sp.]